MALSLNLRLTLKKKNFVKNYFLYLNIPTASFICEAKIKANGKKEQTKLRLAKIFNCSDSIIKSNAAMNDERMNKNRMQTVHI